MLKRGIILSKETVSLRVIEFPLNLYGVLSVTLTLDGFKLGKAMPAILILAPLASMGCGFPSYNRNGLTKNSQNENCCRPAERVDIPALLEHSTINTTPIDTHVGQERMEQGGGKVVKEGLGILAKGKTCQLIPASGPIALRIHPLLAWRFAPHTSGSSRLQAEKLAAFPPVAAHPPPR